MSMSITIHNNDTGIKIHHMHTHSCSSYTLYSKFESKYFADKTFYFSQVTAMLLH